MKNTWIRPLVCTLAVLILLSPPAALLAPERPAGGPVPAAPGKPARLTPEQAIRAALGDLREVGANDFRLSDMGQDNTYDAAGPAVAYNSTDDEYLVVWYGDDDVGTLVDGEYEIYAQRVDAATGAELGPDLRLSDMGPDGDLAYDARNPAVAYNPVENEYLVVWYGDDNTGQLVDEEFEIYGQRVEANTGAEIGPDLRLSNMGFDGSPNYDALDPAVAYNVTANEYLVVWCADDNIPPLVVQELEIYGQRVDGTTGAEIGADDMRLSDMGPDGFPDYDALLPAVAYNLLADEYLVVWQGDDNTAPLVDEEFEVFGQRVDGTTGVEVGENDFRLSDMGPDGDPNYSGGYPAVAYNAIDDEYLVVWTGDDDTAPLVDEEREVFGQRMDGTTGAEVGENDFRLSDMGPDGDPAYGTKPPTVAYDALEDEYLVLWLGDDDTAPLVEGEFEVFGQRVDAATGAEVGNNDFRLSDMGPDGDPKYSGGYPAVACNSTAGEYLVVWQGDDNTPPLADEEFEIFGQRVDGTTGAELGTDQRLSNAGPDGDPAYDAWFPAVAYNSTDDEYLVVWAGNDNTPTQSGEEFEVYGQRVDARTGAEIGPDLRLSDMGPDGNPDYSSAYPAVAYNSAANEYLVVWAGDDGTPPLVEDEFEVFAQRVDATTGAEVGANDFRLSDMGPDGDPNYDARGFTAVAYNSIDDEYLVVWTGDDNTPPLVDEEFEVFGQRVDGTTGAEIGANDFRLSDMGPDGSPIYGARLYLALAYNSQEYEYLVVWQGDDDTGPLVDEELEIYAQRVEANTGAEIGPDLRLSDMGPDGNPAYDAACPRVAYNPIGNEYLVVWAGDDNTPPLVDEELEVYGQRVDGATGAEVGENDFRLSDMGPDGDPNYGGGIAAVAYNPFADEYLVTWMGDDDVSPLVEDEVEIFGQRVDAATGAEVGANDFRLSDMGPDGALNYLAAFPALAYNSIDNEYLVVWQGDDNTPPLVDEEFEVFGQRVAGGYQIYLPIVARGS